MEEYKLYITALRRKGANDKIEPVIIEQFRELLAEQFDMYYQAWIEHNVELLEKILYDHKYLRKSFSDQLKNIPDQIEIMAGQFVQTYKIFNKIYQNEAAKKSISDDIRGIEKSSKYANTVLSYLYKLTNAQHKDIAEYCDIFYIGGTKVGAFCGEAVVFTKENAPRHFVTLIKQHGALLAKGWFLGVQFDTLFTDDLYMKISKNAIETAARLKEILKEKGYDFYIDSPTNQIFVEMEDEKLKELEKNVRVSFWEKTDEKHTVVRFATSWATDMEKVENLREYL